MEVFGQCSECHDGEQAVGKSEFHQPTNEECDACHTTIAFIELQPDGSYDHSNIVRSCSGCHNGIVSIGMPPTTADTPPGTHPDTTSECGFCHTTLTFSEPYPDHTGPDVEGHQCAECHGVSALGEPQGHPVMNVDCQVCHGITTFSMDGVFNHSLIDSVNQPCRVCHDGNNSINAIGPTDTVTHQNTTADCGACHSSDSFTPAFGIDHTDLAVTSVRCDSCHNGTDAIGTVDAPHTHMALDAAPNTGRDCGECHEAGGTFTTGTYDHLSVTNNCESCHNNDITLGKLINHLPTSEDCVVCHTIGDFVPATFSHTGITNNCDTCHDGNITIGKPLTHIPTDQDCALCHATTSIDSTTFMDTPNFAHIGITDNCESCHSGDSDYTAAGAIGKNLYHIPALNECVACHTDSNMGGFASSATFMNLQHPDILTGCEGCHTDRFLPTVNSSNQNIVKATTHLPTQQDCYFCHVNTGFSPAITPLPHTGITSDCASCHDGSANNVAAGAIGDPGTAIHQNTTGDCSICHNTTNFADAFVDHNSAEVTAVRCDSCHNGTDATGKDAKTNPPHVQTTEDCGVCHIAGGTFTNAVFNHQGIVDNCESCHNGVDATGKDAKIDPPHVTTTEDCSVCHIAGDSFAGAVFNHVGIVDNCVICHDGITARGQIPPPNHVPTNEDCANCHQTTGFLPATFDHTGIVDNCSSCHDAGYATGKPDNHVFTIQDCGVCHSVGDSFAGATFDHTGIVDNCESCHDGNTAIGKADAVPTHIATSLDCHFCHTTATFVGGSWVHGPETVGVCDTCHNDTGGGATPKSIDHLNTTEQCDICHTTNAWAPTIFSHDPNGNYPGDHRRDPGCNGCHGPIIGSGPDFPWPSLQYAPYCAACHENDFRRKDKHIGGSNGTVEQNKDCSGGGRGCHRVSDRGFD
jgi:hypothetical protein